MHTFMNKQLLNHFAIATENYKQRAAELGGETQKLTLIRDIFREINLLFVKKLISRNFYQVT